MGVRAFAAIVFSLAALASGWQVQPPLHHYESNRVSMACTYAIDAYGPDGDALPAILDAALDEVDRIDRLMSNYKPDSPLSRINREAAAAPSGSIRSCSTSSRTRCATRRDSGGAFDITVGPLMKAWGFFCGEGHLPRRRSSPRRGGIVGARHVILDRAATYDPIRSTEASSSTSGASPRATPSIAPSSCCGTRACRRPSSAPAAARSTGSVRRPAAAPGTCGSRIRSMRGTDGAARCR